MLGGVLPFAVVGAAAAFFPGANLELAAGLGVMIGIAAIVIRAGK